jgi:hypothetical protein
VNKNISYKTVNDQISFNFKLETKALFMIIRLLFICLLLGSHLIIFGQSKLGVEFSYSGTSGSIDLPGALKDKFTKVEGGEGNSLMIGLTLRASKKIILRGGLSFWEMPFAPSIEGTLNGSPVIAKETAVLNFSGVYLRLDRPWRYFYLSGGFDFSFSNSFEGNVEIQSLNGTRISKVNNLTKSTLTSEFYNQANLILGLGPNIPIGNHFVLRGNLSIGVPLATIYDSGVVVQQIYINTGNAAPDAKVNLRYLPFVSYGLSVLYNF